MKSLGSLIALTIVVFIDIISLHYLKKNFNSSNKLVDTFFLVIIDMVFWCVGLVLQILIINMGFESAAFYIDSFCVFPFIVLLPITLFFFARAYEKEELVFKKKYILLFVIPCITMFVLVTNNKYHLFYEQYSTQFNLTKFGPYNYVHCAFTYGLLAIDIYKILKTNIKKHMFYTKQTLLIIAGVMIPLVINIIGTFNIIPMSIYITPITFSLTMLLWGIAILKYDFLSISPIALKKIVDQMSDAYIVLNNNYEISDCNKSFEQIFKVKKEYIVGSKFNEIGFNNRIKLKNKSFGGYLDKVQKSNQVYSIDASLKDNSKFFNIEISAIVADNRCVGILILFKDTTQHIQDMQALKDNQNILMERERLATLGQMVGGIAHNLKTPIMSIAGAMEGMQDLIKEYESSIEDDEVTKEDHHAIAQDMYEWVNKVNSYDAYMSDIITSVKGQAVGFNDATTDEFTIDELLKRVNILMRHELKNNFTVLNVNCTIPKTTTLHGNVNNLVQIVNNLISNSIQAYNEKKDNESKIGDNAKIINLNVTKEAKNITISVEDFGSGISQEVQDKLFKSMITTKGHNGTGLGLFMSYSTIKAHFNGDLNFTSKVGKGTTFNIVIPV